MPKYSILINQTNKEVVMNKKGTVSDGAIKVIEYGALYNFYAVVDSRNIAATDWHAPSATEWNTLSDYINPNSDLAGGPLMETGTTHWNACAHNTDAYGFHARGSGQRLYTTGLWAGLKNNGCWWTTTPKTAPRSEGRYVEVGYPWLANPWDEKRVGQGVRLIKDSSSLSHGQTGTYTGNDGTVYSTIKIGTQEWTSENLIETKYRNGDLIPIVTSNTEWMGLSTGAMCYYNNDIDKAYATRKRNHPFLDESLFSLKSKFIFSVTVPTGTTMILPLKNGYVSNFSVDYGDGTTNNVTTYNDTGATHIYTNAGTYDVKISGTCQSFFCEYGGNIIDKIVEIKQWGNCDFRKLAFDYCTNLANIPNSPITGAADITNLDNLFNRCTSLSQNIPSNLLSECTKVTSVQYIFSYAGFTGSIPADLFRYNTGITTFSLSFAGSTNLIGSIPSTLFRYNSKVAALAFYNTFNGCSGLSGSIPSDLFSGCTLVGQYGFQYTFAGCTGLSGSIPVQLFSGCTSINLHDDVFEGTFQNCSGLSGTIPEDLFRNNIYVKEWGFAYCFQGCTGLTGSIPTDLFRYNTAVTNDAFYGTFDGCVSLTGTIPADLFRYNTFASNCCYWYTFRNCIGLTEAPDGLLKWATTHRGGYRTFYGCNNLKINQFVCYDSGQQATKFASMTFVNFGQFLYRTSFGGAQGTAPDLWNCAFGANSEHTSCYSGAGNSITSLSNYASIPIGWL